MEEISEQMRTLGFESSGYELKSFIIKYWVEKGTYRIRKIENNVDFEITYMGMQTPAKLNTVLYLKDYNEKVMITAPI
jgi:hypothetical protein